MSTGVQALLEAVGGILQNHQKNRQKSGADFNIFSILGLESDEVRLHSAFLGKLLDPNGEHGCGDESLKAFLSLTASSLQFSPKTTKVYCELFAGDLGRIDITVVDDKSLLVIENKIYAAEQANQLGRYDEYAKKSGKKYEIYYLTLHGDDSKENNDLVGYKKISYAKDILHWLENISLPQAVSPVVSQYCSLVRRLTNQNDRGVEMEIEKLLTTKEAIMSADAISNALANVKASVEMKFWKDLHDCIKNAMSESGFEISPDIPWNFDEADKEYIAQERAKSGGVVSVAFEFKLQDDTTVQFHIEQECAKPIDFAILVIGKDSNRKKDEKISILAKEIGLNRTTGTVLWEYHRPETKLDGEGLYDLVDDASRAEIVRSIADEAILYVEKLKGRLK